HRAGCRAADGRTPRQHARQLGRREIFGGVLLERVDVAAQLFRVDLFEEGPEHFLEDEVGALLQRPGSDHGPSRRSSCRTSFRWRWKWTRWTTTRTTTRPRASATTNSPSCKSPSP